jgi:queuine tRNA-ribosyltransferase
VTAEHHVEGRSGRARAGTLRLRDHTVATPAFMPVGTYGSVKGVHPDDLRAVGSSILLANACHLHDRPGEGVVSELGGVRRLMGWSGPVLTDSGGYQVFSMLDVAKLDEDGVSFRSPIDGRALRLTPESVVDVQLALDSDVAMVLDHCPPLPATAKALEQAVSRTTRWARRARAHHAAADSRGQAQFGIVQGGLDDALRARSAEELVGVGFDGYAMGGLSVGEGSEALQAAAGRYAPLLPEHEVRYLMGVGRPQDVLAAIAAGFDLFDCVLPSRNGRHGTVFREHGVVHLRNSRFRGALGPLDESCDCRTCAEWDIGTLAHLVRAGEPLGRSLCTIHNLRFVHRLVERAREAILADALPSLLSEWGVPDPS